MQVTVNYEQFYMLNVAKFCSCMSQLLCKLCPAQGGVLRRQPLRARQRRPAFPPRTAFARLRKSAAEFTVEDFGTREMMEWLTYCLSILAPRSKAAYIIVFFVQLQQDYHWLVDLIIKKDNSKKTFTGEGCLNMQQMALLSWIIMSCSN